MGVAALGSAVFSIFALEFAVGRYRAELTLRLDPTGIGRFSRLNRELVAAGGPRIVLFGDSRVEYWDPILAVDGFTVINRGWGGETTAQALLRVDRDVLALHPDLVIIEYGVNDLKAIGVFPEYTKNILLGCQQRLQQLVHRIRTRGVPVLLLTIFPVGKVPLYKRLVWSDETINAINSVNRQLRVGPVQKGVLVLDADRVLRTIGGDRIVPQLAADQLHLNIRGYQALNAAIKPAVASILRDSRNALQ
jgi:lysophospholipase L1-like esterase